MSDIKFETASEMQARIEAKKCGGKISTLCSPSAVVDPSEETRNLVEATLGVWRTLERIADALEKRDG